MQQRHSRYSAKERMEYVQKYLESGLSLSIFSKENNIKKSTLATWVNHYTSANLIASTKFQDITPILKQEQPTINNNIKLSLPNGVSLEFDSSLLHDVLKEFKW